MPEDNPHSPFEEVPQHGLVPVQESQEPLFQLTDQQRRNAEKYMISYMRKGKIPFTTDGITDATGVLLGDALPKGAKAKGLVGIAHDDDVVEIIKAGVAQRDTILKKGKSIFLEYRNAVQSADNPHIGPYALPRRSLVAMSRELQKPETKQFLTANEQIIGISEGRAEMLPKITDAILQALPREQFPDATIELFPDSSDQAKIVRNVLTSIAFRRTPNPIISISELQDFVRETMPEPDEVFNAFGEAVVERTGLAPQYVKDYLKDLYRQISYEINKERRSQVGDEAVFRDLTYVQFNRYLLLLHPALEEKELIVNPEEFTADTYSIWRDSVSTVIGGFRVPSAEVLSSAERLAVAKGQSGSRFREALHYWKAYRIERDAKARRVERDKKRIEELKERLEQFSMSDVTESDIQLQMDVDARLLQDYRVSRSRRNEYRRVISRTDAEYGRIHEYLEEVRRENKGQFPAKFTVPLTDTQIKRVTHGKEATHRARLLRIESEASDIFNNDFLSNILINSDDTSKVDFNAVESSAIQSLLATLEEQQRDAVASHSNTIPLSGVTIGDVESHLRSTIATLSTMDEYLRRTAEKPSDAKGLGAQEKKQLKDYQKFLELYESMFKDTDPLTPGVPRQFYLYSQGRKISALKRVLFIRAKRDVQRISESEPTEVSSETAEQAVRLQEIKKPQIVTDEERILVNHHLDLLLQLRGGLSYLHRYRLPQTFEGKAEFIAWTGRWGDPETEEAKSIRHLSPYNKKIVIRDFDRLARAMNNPLFPSEDLMKGLPMHDLLSAIGARISYIEAVTRLPDVTQKTEALRQQAEDRAFFSNKEQLTRQIEKLEGEVAVWEAKDPEGKFLSKMAELRLLVPQLNRKI